MPKKERFCDAFLIECGRWLPASGDSSLGDAMRYLVLDGESKNLRSSLMMGLVRLLGGGVEAALLGGVAVEFVHNYSLIHDDLPAIDNDDYRRGKPSCHKKFGESIAILAGDGLLTLAFEVLTDLAKYLAPDVTLKIIAILARDIGSRGMILGQYRDIVMAKGMGVFAREKIALKTTSLFESICEIAGIISGVDSSVLSFLREYGKCFGEILQALDDIADSEQDGCSDEGIAQIHENLRILNQKMGKFQEELSRYGDISLLMCELKIWAI